MPNLLKQLELEELSLVDRPANAQATVSLFKRDNSQGETMSEELEKMSDDMKAKVKAYMDKGYGEEEAMKMAEEDMKKSEEIEALKAENERLRKSLIEEGYVIKADAIEKKAEPEYIEYEGEKINKADIPAPILKALEAAEIEKADAALTKRAEERLPNFAVDTAKEMLKAVDMLENPEEVMKSLEAADKALGGHFEEIGKSGADSEFETASDKLDALVKAYQKEHAVSYAKAYDAVYKTDEGKALIKKTYEEK